MISLDRACDQMNSKTTACVGLWPWPRLDRSVSVALAGVFAGLCIEIGNSLSMCHVKRRKTGYNGIKNSSVSLSTLGGPSGPLSYEYFAAVGRGFLIRLTKDRARRLTGCGRPRRRPRFPHQTPLPLPSPLKKYHASIHGPALRINEMGSRCGKLWR